MFVKITLYFIVSFYVLNVNKNDAKCKKYEMQISIFPKVRKKASL